MPLVLRCRVIMPWTHRRAATRAAALSTTASDITGRWTLASAGTAELEVKKSRFIAFVWPVSSPDEAMVLIDSRRDAKARHNVWAYKCGDAHRCTDDGEPSGTAGRPLLSALGGLDHVAVLVVRHFGGVLLGTGGLARAYSAAASAAVDDAGRLLVPRTVDLSVVCSWSDRAAVEAAVAHAKGVRVREEQRGDGVALVLRVSASCLVELQTALADATAGRVKLDLAS